MTWKSINQEKSIVRKPYVKKLRPKCIPSEEHKIGETQGLGHSAQGYILPCCWMDTPPLQRSKGQEVFYQEKFKISNVDDIKKDILESKEWVEFYLMLQQAPNRAPEVCYKNCGEDNVGDKYGEE